MARAFDSRTFERWAARQDKDRQRSQARRDHAKLEGRPNGSAVDRAIVEALQSVWAGHVDKQVAGGVPRKLASRDPISPGEVASRALDILVTRKRADRKLAGEMIMARLSPHPRQEGFAVPKADDPLRTPLTSYS